MATTDIKPKGQKIKDDVLGILEDDEFEEFPAETYTESKDIDEEVKVWADNWDEDVIEDDFSKQLRAELVKQQGQGGNQKSNGAPTTTAQKPAAPAASKHQRK